MPLALFGLLSTSLEQLLEVAGCRTEIAPEQTLDRFQAAALLEDCWQLQESAHGAVRRLLT